MLQALTIQDVVLIKHLDLQLQHGLCVLSGETGAGKSILLDALGLALGERGDSRLVRKGQPQASITANFELKPDSPLHSLLKEHGLISGPELLLRRVLTCEGRSRAFINDQPVGIGLLKLVGAQLIEIHGQFDRLLEPRYHRDFLDNFADLAQASEKIEQAYKSWNQARKDLEKALEISQEKQLNEAYLRHALEELEGANVQIGEEAELHEKRSRLANSAKILEISQEISYLLDNDKGTRSQLNKALRLIEKGVGLDQKRFETIAESLEASIVEIDEAAAQLSDLIHECGDGPSSLDKIEHRLITLRSLSRKHQCLADDLPKVLEKIIMDMELIDNSEVRIKELEKAVEEARNNYVTQAKNLSEKRKQAAAQLDNDMDKELKPLKLESAIFKTDVSPLEENQWGSHGMDQVKFVVATNKGAAAGDLKSIASGGERSRFMLALKVLLSEKGSVPTLIFDEIDSGIGGATAHAVGERLRQLSKNTQVLVITHSPQVASMANQHLKVEKKTIDNMTVTSVGSLDEKERREEIARMLAGDTITKEARAAADQLLHVG